MTFGAVASDSAGDVVGVFRHVRVPWLVAPASARYSKMTVTRTIVPHHKWEVKGVVDSQNAFGAMLRTDVYCLIWTYDGTEFATTPFDTTIP